MAATPIRTEYKTLSLTQSCTSNSFIRFAVRAMVQAVYIMPKPKGFPEQNVPQPYVGGVIGTNIICIIFHIFNSPPEAGEATRGYLHGSLILDFIGQQGPTSKLRLLLLDVLILVLQFMALATIHERNELDARKTPDESTTSTTIGTNNQDHDAEERGEVRGTSIGSDAIELQDLGDNRLGTAMQGPEGPAQNHTFAISDNIASGQAIIGDFLLLDSARRMYRAYEDRRRQMRETDARVAEGGLVAMHGLRQRLSEQLTNRAAPG